MIAPVPFQRLLPLDVQDCLPQQIGEDVLRKYFLLTEPDLVEVQCCRGEVNRLGFAVQLCTLRWRGHFLPDMCDLPLGVLEFLAPQVNSAVVPIPEYPHNEKTRWEHLERIRCHLGFVKCEETQRQRLFNHLCAQAILMPRAAALHQEACRWLFEQRIVRPGQTTVQETIATAKEAALTEVYNQLNEGLNSTQKQRLDELLEAFPSTQTTEEEGRASGSRLEQFKILPRRESPAALDALANRLSKIQELGFGSVRGLKQLHPAIRGLLASWGYRYDVWSLRRFAPAKRYSIVLVFLQAALAETLDAIIEMQDKLITRVHNHARLRRETILQASEQARTRAVIMLEGIGSMVLDEAIPDDQLRMRIYSQWSNADLAALITECRQLRARDDGSYLSFLVSWYGYTRKYSPTLLMTTPFEFARCSAVGEAAEYLKAVNQPNGRSFGDDAPTGFLTHRWEKYVRHANNNGGEISRPYYELAFLTTLNERLKSGDVTVPASRRWTDFNEYLIPANTWQQERLKHYTGLGLPPSAEEFIQRLSDYLAKVTAEVDAHMPTNQAVTIDTERGDFTLTPLTGLEAVESVEQCKHLIESQLPRTDLVDVLIEMDNETDFLRHFTSQGTYEIRPSAAVHRRNVLAALISVGCNIGPQRMAAASPGLNYRDISRIADWSFSEETLKAAVIDLVNYAVHLPLSQLYGSGNTCAADGLRFYQQAIPCKLREAIFNLDGLIEHDTELDPKTCFTDTHGYTEVVMATAALLGFELAPRIRDIKDQTLYKMNRQQSYPHLDCLLSGIIRPALIQQAWDEVVRVIAPIKARVVSPSLILHRLGSYARQNSIHQALTEIGRVYKTIWILRYLDDEALRRRTGRELNKGEASHDLSRFLCFGKEGQLRGREFEDQLHTFSCLAILHNAVIAWNMRHIAQVVDRLRAEGHPISDTDLALTSPLVRRHINPYGRYHFELTRFKRGLE